MVIDNKKFVNTTPHSITLQSSDGTLYSVPPCGKIVNARLEEADNGIHPSGVFLVKTVPKGDEEGSRIIEEIYDSVGKDAIIIGSMLAVQAYPNLIFGMVPVQGFERVPPDQKRMRTDKFSS